MTINELIRQAMTCELPRPRYAYMAPQYGQAKDIAWDFLRYYAEPIGGVSFNEAELRADLPNGARIRLLGASNADTLRGRYLDGIVLDEYGYMDPEAWSKVIRPALSDRQGFAIFIGTPVGRNDFFRKYERAKSDDGMLAAFYPASQTGVLPQSELDAALADIGEAAYAQEYECSFEAAIRGAYYAKELAAARNAGRIRHVEWEPNTPVETWWDLGYSDSTAIIFTQTIGREVRCIDYLEERGQQLAFYAKALFAKPYVYGKHQLPHDANQTELGTGKSITDQLRGLGLRELRVGRPNEPLEGIQAARVMFPRCWFDEQRCARLIDCLANYRSQWDEKRQDQRPEPYHDWASHGADAFRYLAVGHRDHIEAPRATQYASPTRNPWDLPGQVQQRQAVASVSSGRW